MAAACFGVAAPTQAALATQFIDGASGCDASPIPDACDQGLDDRRIPAVFSSIRLVADAINGGVTIAQATIDMALAHGIVLLNVALASGDYHFVLVGAHQQGSYSVADPHYDVLESVTWNQLFGYQGGAIAQAWRVFPQ